VNRRVVRQLRRRAAVLPLQGARVEGAGLAEFLGRIAVDPLPTLGVAYLDAIRSVTDKPIRYIIYSHSHTDHIGASGLFPKEAKVIALGTGKKGEDGKVTAFEVKVGDLVLISKYGGTEVKLGEKKYTLVREDDILGVIA